MFRFKEINIDKIDQSIGNVEGHLFDAENIIGEFIDDYFATDPDEKDDASMKQLDIAERLRDRVNDLYDITCQMAELIEQLRNEEE